MSFDTDKYPNRKDWVKEYPGKTSKNVDRTCRCHGSCSYCRDGRLHKHRRREPIHEKE